MDDKERKNRIILIITTVLTLLVMIAGTTFAYLTVTVTGNNTASSVIIKSSSIGIIYDSGADLIASGIEPGDSFTKTFKVINKGDAPAVYNIVWVDVYNNLATKNDLTYTVTGVIESGTGSASNKASTPMPSSNGSMITGITINGNTVHTYTLKVTFEDRGTPDNSNQGKTFSARIQISA